MDFKGTQTEKNLRAALAGESIARNKYTFFADQARQEGKTEIVELFERMAQNETAHAKIWYQLLNGRKSSDANLQEAAAGEYGEWRSMYPDFARQARKDGFEELAEMFQKVAAIEQEHECQFLMAYAKLFSTQQSASEQKKIQEEIRKKAKTSKPGYRCAFCGAVFETRPDVCNVCQAIGAFEPCTIESK